MMSSESGLATVIYEPNDKHKKPWQRGKRGSLCPPDIDLETAGEMLDGSVVEGRKRFASDGTGAYCAQEHLEGRWHGYPVGWEEVPPGVRAELAERLAISSRVIRRYWRSDERS